MTEVTVKQYQTTSSLTKLTKENKKNVDQYINYRISLLLLMYKEEITEMWGQLSQIKNLKYKMTPTEEEKIENEKGIKEIIRQRDEIIKGLSIYNPIAKTVGDYPERVLDIYKTILWNYSDGKQKFIDCLNGKIEAYIN